MRVEFGVCTSIRDDVSHDDGQPGPSYSMDSLRAEKLDHDNSAEL